MYEMMAGDPLKDPSVKVMFPKGKRAFSREAEDIVLRLLKKDPEDRLGHRGIDEIKDHAFFKKIIWKDMLIKKALPAFVPRTDSDMTKYFDKSIVTQKFSNVSQEDSQNSPVKMD